METPATIQPKASSTQDQNHYENNPMGTLLQSGFNVTCEYDSKTSGDGPTTTVLDQLGVPIKRELLTVVTKMVVSGPGVNLKYTIEGDSKLSTRRAGATRAINFLMSLCPPPVRLANIVSGKELTVDTAKLISLAPENKSVTAYSRDFSRNRSFKKDVKRNFIKSFLQLGFFPLARVTQSADPINGVQASAKLTISESDTVFYGTGPSATVAKNECLVKAYDYITRHQLKPGFHESGFSVYSKPPITTNPTQLQPLLTSEQQTNIATRGKYFPTRSPISSRGRPPVRGGSMLLRPPLPLLYSDEYFDSPMSQQIGDKRVLSTRDSPKPLMPYISSHKNPLMDNWNYESHRPPPRPLFSPDASYEAHRPEHFTFGEHYEYTRDLHPKHYTNEDYDYDSSRQIHEYHDYDYNQPHPAYHSKQYRSDYEYDYDQRAHEFYPNSDYYYEQPDYNDYPSTSNYIRRPPHLRLRPKGPMNRHPLSPYWPASSPSYPRGRGGFGGNRHARGFRGRF